MALSIEQIGALQHAQQILSDAGLLGSGFDDDDSSPASQLRQTFDAYLGSTPHPDIENSHYLPGPATPFTPEEIRSGANRLTRKAYVNARVLHPVGAIIEYPQSGSLDGEAVAHLCRTNHENLANPRANIQYSLGDAQGQHTDVICHLLHDRETQEPLKCRQSKVNCRGIKRCSFSIIDSSTSPPGDFASFPSDESSDSRREVFFKTLGLFCALMEHGCLFTADSTFEWRMEDSDVEEETEPGEGTPTDLEYYEILQDARSRKAGISHCKGKLILCRDKHRRPYIQCEHYKKGHRAHLIIRNLDQFRIEYLQALLENNISEIQQHEEEAKARGYGPLVPCTFFAAAREQKMLCPMWHRGLDGVLVRGVVERTVHCVARFEFYTPQNPQDSEFVLMVCRNPHSHPNPPPSKTPKTILKIFNHLLLRLDWKLADATPRRVLLDTAFMTGLRDTLGWVGLHDPTLADLHPSLGNHDHAWRLIHNLRCELFPHGTGLEGARLLLAQHNNLPAELQYVRCIEEHEIPGEGTFRVVVCMLKAMSELLWATKRPSIDTSFKRVHGWQEFEVEAWFPEFSRSIVVARAFINSQSAAAHHILFKTIFSIVKHDTGRLVRFRHIDGDGWEIVMADAHKGQALGLGMCLQEICANQAGYCAIENNKPLHSLTPYEHLARIYRYCFAHFVRHVREMRKEVSGEVRQAMLRLASAEPLPDFEGTLNLIRKGGKKAANWLKDKEKSSPFAIPALYQPASKIPLEVWRASPSTSNGNEQSHRNINRDGIKLTLLAGINRGMQYDSRAMRGIHVLSTHGIHSRDQQASHFRRAARAIARSDTVQKRALDAQDSEIAASHQTLLKLQQEACAQSQNLKRAIEAGGTTEHLLKKLKTTDERLRNSYAEFTTMKTHGSGTVPLSGLHDPASLFDRHLLEYKPPPSPIPRPPHRPPPSISHCPPPSVQPILHLLEYKPPPSPIPQPPHQPPPSTSQHPLPAVHPILSTNAQWHQLPRHYHHLPSPYQPPPAPPPLLPHYSPPVEPAVAPMHTPGFPSQLQALANAANPWNPNGHVAHHGRARE